MKCSLPGCDREARSNKTNSTCGEAHKSALKRINNPGYNNAYQRAYQARKKPPREIVAKTCACGCGRTFTVGTGKGMDNRIYFSRTCKNKANNAKHKHAFAPQVCEFCGVEYLPKKLPSRSCSSAECQKARKAEWRKSHTPVKVEKVAKPTYPKELAGTGIKPVKRSAHVVSRDQWKMDILCEAAMLEDYNPRNPEPYIQRVLARQAA